MNTKKLNKFVYKVSFACIPIYIHEKDSEQRHPYVGSKNTYICCACPVHAHET